MKCFLATILVLLAFNLHASVMEVGPGKFFVSITNALAAAKDGDVIAVYKAVYTEGEIVIRKRVTLKGINKPVLNGNQKNQILRIEYDGVTISGFVFNNAGYSSTQDWAAVKGVNCMNLTVSDNTFFNNIFGIYFQNVTRSRIINNIVEGTREDEVQSGNAIHCWKCDYITISNNSATKHRDGIYFEFVTNSIVQNNKSYNNLRYGLHFMFSNNDIYLNNIFRQNGSGVAVMFSKGVTMKANHFEENWGAAAYGILMKEISGGTVENNTFLKNTVGIFMEGTTRIVVSKNVFKSNGWAMKVQSSCDDNTITNNNYFGNTFDVGTNGNNQLNKFIHNYWDKYEGYDLNRDGLGDVFYLPVSLYSMIIEKNPSVSILLRSFMATIMDKAERVLPGITPVKLRDEQPLMKPLAL